MFLVVLLHIGAFPVHAQESAGDGEPSPQILAPDYRWAHFVQHPTGLMSNDVWSVAATDRAVWVGTDRGVSYYDGDWVNFTPVADDDDEVVSSDPAAGDLPSATIHALAVAEDGSSILAGNEDGSAFRWDGATWTRIADMGKTILSIAENDGSVLMGTDAGLYITDDGSESVAVTPENLSIFALEHVRGILFAGTNAGLWQLSEGEWEAVSIDGLGGRQVRAISSYGPDGIALGTPSGLLVVDDQLRTMRQLAVTDELGRNALVQALSEDEYGRLWAGTDGAGAYEFSPGASEGIPHGQADDASVTIRYVRDVTVDTDGSVWFATPTGMYRYQVGMWHSDVQGASVADPLNHVNDLLVSQDGALWIATGGGGVRMKPEIGAAETVFGLEDGVPTTVLTLAEDAEGQIWAGTFYGLFRYDGAEWSLPVVNERLPNTTITALLFDSPRLWIGTEGGLAVYDMATATVHTVDELDGFSVEALAKDGLARLWAGTKSAGAWVESEDGEWMQHRHDPDVEGSLPGNYVVSGGLVADWRTPGHVWAIVSREGLAHWNGERWRIEDAGNQIPVNLLWMLNSESDPGRLWIGSEGGVTQFDGNTWGTFSQDDGLQSATAYAMARAEDGGHWIGGATGLSYYRPDATPPWVRVAATASSAEPGRNEGLRVAVGDTLSVDFRAGDLQTQQDKLYVMRRLVNSANNRVSEENSGSDVARAPEDREGWVEDTPGTLTIPVSDAGLYELQFVARDQSFNYSDVVRMPIEVFVPPPKVDVPGLGPVDPNTFTALIVLAIASVMGAGYVMFEIVRQRTRSVEALNRGFNPYISGEPVRTQEMFFGRRDLVQRIADTLHNNSVMIHGERRIGKTTLLFQLTTLLRKVDDPEYWFVPIYVDLEGTPQNDFFHLLIEEIVMGVLRLPDAHEALQPYLEDLEYRKVDGAAYDDRTFNRDLHEVIDLLSAYGTVYQPGKQLRLILLLDEMDVMSGYDSIVQQQLRRIFMREFASTVGAVVAGILISKEWDRIESPWYNMFNEIELEPFTDEEANALLIEPVAGYYRYDDEALEFIVARSEGRPYRVQQYGLEAVNHMLSNRRRKVRLHDAEEAHERIISAPINSGLVGPAATESVDDAKATDAAIPAKSEE